MLPTSSCVIPNLSPSQLQRLRSRMDPADKYRAIWVVHEEGVSQALQSLGQAPLGPAERGRGRTTEVTVKRGDPGPVHKARDGETSPAYLAPTCVMPIGSGNFVAFRRIFMRLPKEALNLVPCNTALLLGMPLSRLLALPPVSCSGGMSGNTAFFVRLLTFQWFARALWWLRRFFNALRSTSARLKSSFLGQNCKPPKAADSILDLEGYKT